MTKTAVLLYFAPLVLLAQSQTVVFTHATVINADGARPQSDVTVVITGDRITDVGKKASFSPQAQVVDASGKFLIPGLWDMHSHIHRAEDLQLFIANGVTGLRIMGALPAISQMRTRIERGEEVGPRMAIGSRLMDGTSDPGQPAASPNPTEAEIAQEWSDVMKGGRPRSIVVRTESEGHQAVIDAKRGGAEFIKVHEGLSREAYFAIAAETKKQGLIFVGHVPPLVSAAEASDAGQTSIEHSQGVLLACSTREEELLKATEDLASQQPDQRASGLAKIQRETLDSYSQDKAMSLTGRFVRNRTWQCPTLTSRFGTKERAARSGPTLHYISAQMRARWQRGLSSLPQSTPEQQAAAQTLDQKLIEMVGMMHRGGVQFLAGTDVGGAFLVPGFSMHDELEELVKAGFTSMEALRAATLDAARFLGREKDLGTIQKGKLADLVVLDANPLDDIRNTRKIDAVIARGRLLDRKALDAALFQVETASGKQ